MYDHFLFNLIHHEYVFYLSLCRTFMPYVFSEWNFYMEIVFIESFRALENFPILTYYMLYVMYVMVSHTIGMNE